LVSAWPGPMTIKQGSGGSIVLPDPPPLQVRQSMYLAATRYLDGETREALARWATDAGIEVVVPAERTALYHAAPGRKYQPSRRERESGRYECPACHVIMVRVTRKAKDPLFRCSGCGWSIARSDIFEPESGETPALRDDVEYGEGVVPAEAEPKPW